MSPDSFVASRQVARGRKQKSCGLLETFLRGGRRAVALWQRRHTAGALQAGLKSPLVRRLQRVVEGISLSWKVVPQAPVGSEGGEKEQWIILFHHTADLKKKKKNVSGINALCDITKGEVEHI